MKNKENQVKNSEQSNFRFVTMGNQPFGSEQLTMNKGKVIIFLTLFTLTFFLFPLNLSAFDFSLRTRGFASFPMGEGNIDPLGFEKYTMGGGGDIGFEVDFSTIWTNPIGLGYTLGVEGGFMINPFQNDNEMNVNFYSAGGVLSLYYFPLSRLFIRADGTLGIYAAATPLGNSSADLFWRAGGEIGFRFSPNFLLAANAGWKQFQVTGSNEQGSNVFNSGVYAGLTAQISFQTGRGISEGVGAVLEQSEPVYPAFTRLYQSFPVGDVVIRNNENAEIRDVRLFFRAGNYTASEFPCGSVSIIPRGRTVTLPLLADFSNEVLRFTDNGRIIGELVIRYRFLGQERETVRAVTVAAHNRNIIPLGDPTAFAAFVSPTSPETLDFARMVAGLERSNRRTGHNTNKRYAVWLIETLRASQLAVNNEQLADRFDQARNIADGTSYVQFPAETLSFRNGTSLDFALLVAACLESVGIGSALISVNNEEQAESELLVAVSLGINAGAAETLFNGTDKILIVDGNVWLPLSMSVFNEGFTACWNKGAQIIKQAFTNNEIVDFIVVQDAWVAYPPAPLPELGRNVLRTDDEAALRAVNQATQTYIEQEINVLLRQVQAQVNANPTAALHNRLGILLARAGRIPEAKTSYERAAALGSVPAMTNRGNLALTENDFTTAERWFTQALQREPQNTAALRGMSQIATGR
ncbi:MAG: hypothetical protein FWD13_07555 [Treponema sp.]|nr:hypothetical protein [Treponema sp.]